MGVQVPEGVEEELVSAGGGGWVPVGVWASVVILSVDFCESVLDSRDDLDSSDGLCACLCVYVSLCGGTGVVCGAGTSRGVEVQSEVEVRSSRSSLIGSSSVKSKVSLSDSSISKDDSDCGVRSFASSFGEVMRLGVTDPSMLVSNRTFSLSLASFDPFVTSPKGLFTFIIES